MAAMDKIKAKMQALRAEADAAIEKNTQFEARLKDYENRHNAVRWASSNSVANPKAGACGRVQKSSGGFAVVHRRYMQRGSSPDGGFVW